MTPPSQYAEQEFVSLRDTIRARSTTRVVVFLSGMGVWAALDAWVWMAGAPPLAAVVPLVFLWATFEVVRALHLGVERIGRYLQVFYEEASGATPPLTLPAWEHTAMQLGPSLPGAGGHPFFLPVTLSALAASYLTVLVLDPLPVEWTMMAVPHVALALWMTRCDRAMRRQRAEDLARFRALRDSALRVS